MTRNSKPLTLLGGAAAVLALALCAGSALAVDNYLVPHGINDWNVPGNWSLGHCPGQLEDVHVEATTTVPKVVNYNWTGISDFNSVKVDGNGGIYGQIYQGELTMRTTTLYMSDNGDSYYYLQDPAFLWITDKLYVGYTGVYDGYFILDTVADPSAGLYVGNVCYVGYLTPGDFDHQHGFAEVNILAVGQNDTGNYELSGVPNTDSKLTVNYNAVIGNFNTGTFEQNGGTANIGLDFSTGIQLGLNPGGYGTYNMRGGVLNVHHISIAKHGDGFFNHTGGEINVSDDVVIGCEGNNPLRAWLKVDDTDDEPTLNIGGDLLIGAQSLAKYEQLGSGTVNVTDQIEIWDGDDDP
ncbi:MAG: hypothetical protein KAS72_06825, partial [Phycisphaerales bacterium]|nr:hypothetical protein [Phycisphaerales bacterium]